MLKTVAVMQPYFFPYGGYFSLMKAVDHFLVFDCVQFPRRGWVHRNRVPGPTGKEEWLTLPLARQSRETLIRDLVFAHDAEVCFAERLRRYSWFSGPRAATNAFADGRIFRLLSTPVEFLASTLTICADLLGIRPQFSFTSALKLDPELRGEDRVIAAVSAVGGSRYVNASGGRTLYSQDKFKRHGLELLFLNPYRGSHWSMLYRMCTEPSAIVAREIQENANPQLE